MREAVLGHEPGTSGGGAVTDVSEPPPARSESVADGGGPLTDGGETVTGSRGTDHRGTCKVVHAVWEGVPGPRPTRPPPGQRRARPSPKRRRAGPERGGSGTQKFDQRMAQLHSSFPNFTFSPYEIWDRGGGGAEGVQGGGHTPPPAVVSRSTTSLG